jgi:hypothetical protein
VGNLISKAGLALLVFCFKGSAGGQESSFPKEKKAQTG